MASWRSRAFRSFDIAIDNDADCTRVGRIGQEMGRIWGGAWRAFRDYPHFETADAAAAVARLKAGNS